MIKRNLDAFQVLLQQKKDRLNDSKDSYDFKNKDL